MKVSLSTTPSPDKATKFSSHYVANQVAEAAEIIFRSQIHDNVIARPKLDNTVSVEGDTTLQTKYLRVDYVEV